MERHDEGYVLDTMYTNNFYKELTPSFLRTLLLLQQVDLPEKAEGEPLRYLELGFGQGTSLCIHASANTGEFWGTDFNPQHALIAKNNLQQAQTKAEVLSDTFAELAQKSKQGLLPTFDIITLHGVWSWVNKENQQHILDIISNSLATGGIVYVSYNTLPGWANFTPVRDFLTYHATSYSYSANTSVSKLKNAFAFLKALKDGGAQYFKANPVAEQKLNALEHQNMSYIIHELMNEDWSPVYFKDMARSMKSAKCSFVTSARPLTLLPMALPPEIKTMMDGVQNVELRETLRDYAHNTQYRCDIFAKGKNILNAETCLARLDALSFALTCPEEHVSYKILCPVGEVQCKEEVYKPLVSYLASDNYAPKTFKNIREQEPYTDLGVLIDVLTVLLGSGAIHPAQEVTPAMQDQCAKLNAHVCKETALGRLSYFLASPVIGSGVPVSPFEQTFLYAKTLGHKTAKDYTKFAAKLYKDNGNKLIVQGEELSEKDGLDHLKKLAADFEKRLPVLQALKIVYTEA